MYDDFSIILILLFLFMSKQYCPLSIKAWNVIDVLNRTSNTFQVIQNRYDGSVNFFRNFSEYEKGFGGIEGEFWLGV